MYKETYITDEDCGGYSLEHNSLPKIVAVHANVQGYEDKPCRNDTREVIKLPSLEKKQWDKLLDGLSLNSGEDFYEIGHKQSNFD